MIDRLAAALAPPRHRQHATQAPTSVALPTNRDSYASRDEQGELLHGRGQHFVRSLLASGGCPLSDTSPRSSGSTLERSKEFAEAPREERE
jgi:hypothetical protein